MITPGQTVQSEATLRLIEQETSPCSVNGSGIPDTAQTPEPTPGQEFKRSIADMNSSTVSN